MTDPNTYTIKQLAQILSALKNKRCNPSSRQEAFRAIERAAAQLDLTADDIFAAAGGLLDGRFTDEEFREELLDTIPPSEEIPSAGIRHSP